MEAAVLKATLAKNRQQDEARDRAQRDQWKMQAGVKTVRASEPAGGW